MADNGEQECLDSGMNFFLSKPIRRPALKHVLKTYCPPIPEEDGEATAPTAPQESSKPNGGAIPPLASTPGNGVGPFGACPTGGRSPGGDETPNISPLS